MAARSPLFVPSSTFIVSAVCTLVSPWALVLGLTPAPRPELPEPPVVSVLLQNEAIRVASDAAREAGVDLTEMECRFSDDNSDWIERILWKRTDPDVGALRPELAKEPYWAFLFWRKSPPNTLDGSFGIWILVRRSDLKVLGQAWDCRM
jgi:hypothetical protein